jgi:phosphoribosyl 1,2-cyclic phosphodiesterase
MVKICALFSGSSGNSTFLSCRDASRFESFSGIQKLSGTSLLVDAGMNGKQMQMAMQSIGETLDEVSGILLTHEHIDHMRGIGVILRRYQIPLFLNEKTYRSIMNMDIGKIPERLIRVIESGKTFEVGDFLINGLRTPHDSADSMGYKITYREQHISVFTDLGQIDDTILDFVTGSQIVFIESNYDTKMLWEGSYPYFLKRRIDGQTGHLSNDDCARTVRTLLERGSERFILSHLSQENNRPSVAMATTLSCLGEQGAKEGIDFQIQVAKRLGPSDVWYL